MKAQRCRSFGLAVLCSALVLSSGNVFAQSSSSAPSDECTDDFMADGDCDLNNNTEACGYDGGDCCECTCVDTDSYECGVRTGFSCEDPSASCYVAGDDDVELVTPSPVTPTTPSPTTAPTSPPVTLATPAPSTAAIPPTASPTSPSETPATRSPIASVPSSTTTSSSTTPTSTSTTPCDADSMSDGNCDLLNNSVNCGASRSVSVLSYAVLILIVGKLCTCRLLI